MQIINKLYNSGEHPLSLVGNMGPIEAILSVPEQADKRYIAIIGHPHSLHGGTMNNKVVTTLVRTFNELGINSLRFNFRGVGQSAGTYDEGVGESEDMLCIARQLLQERQDVQLIFAGFSFGSYVSYRAAAQCIHALLILIAPPVHHYNYLEFSPNLAPWIVVQGDKDEVVPAQLVFDYVHNSHSQILLLDFADTSHFFHGKLIDLKTRLVKAIRERITV